MGTPNRGTPRDNNNNNNNNNSAHNGSASGSAASSASLSRMKTVVSFRVRSATRRLDRSRSNITSTLLEFENVIDGSTYLSQGAVTPRSDGSDSRPSTGSSFGSRGSRASHGSQQAQAQAQAARPN